MAEHVEVVIKIPKYYLTHPQDYTCLAECVRRGTVLPENATNGDMIKAMFNPYEIFEYEFGVHVCMTEDDFWKSEYMKCNKSWWNAPYKADEVKPIIEGSESE